VTWNGSIATIRPLMGSDSINGNGDAGGEDEDDAVVEDENGSLR
jgi:hypothetical protein